MARKKKDGVEGAPAEKKQRWYHNIRDAYRLTRRANPRIPWILLGVFVLVLGLALVVGFLWGHPWYMAFFGVLLGLVLDMVILARQTQKAGYAQIEGQPGAVGAALGTIRRGWTVEEQPVAINPRTQDLVFRLVGRPGIVLISEGPPHRAQRLLEDERKRVAWVAPNVPVHLIQSGREEGQVPLPQIVSRVQKLKGRLTTAEVAQVNKRLQALGGARMPIPKGVDPMRVRPDRKGMRGR
ncbi:DUF4191 domain-containing protein [Georgenia sp. TF02-10]|uniref:DUF4191 domain-containing protein n=1 Tax=Georgenia sp. TF02-10 TaxID=2917725 RepID=UPI001FA7FE10|nr:DUF4191 domain-containing protein [Georgenia sp. TF02-10]UNX53445.1 DUF4191 domain-containing protein [Georgenia sp. TF02-10]